jgi:hypothetical protein
MPVQELEVHIWSGEFRSAEPLGSQLPDLVGYYAAHGFPKLRE